MKVWQVDSFTTEIFKGNPAAVVVLETDITDKLKQNIAMELNLSETAFIVLKKRPPEIRWFTPNSEVDLCGHATLAAAHILWEQNILKEPEIEFQSKSGPIAVTKLKNGYQLDFPLQAGQEAPQNLELVTRIIGAEPTHLSSNGGDCMAVVADEAFVRSFEPNHEAISALPERGFLLTAKSQSEEYDYIYRGFFPKLAVPEDPVTGSANTILAPYWAQALGKSELSAYQASARGGELELCVKEDRVLIAGQALTTMTGELHVG